MEKINDEHISEEHHLKEQKNLSTHPEIVLSLESIYNERDKRLRKTKIICTLGPSSRKVDDLLKLLDEGMNIARLNFSHGDHKYHRESILNLREALKQRPKLNCAIMLDTKGPEIRTGRVEDKDGVKLIKGQTLELTIDYSFVGNQNKIAISYPQIVKLKVGQVILFADGNLSGKVTEIKEDGVLLILDNDYVMGSMKNVSLPRVNVELPTLSEKDEDDLVNFGLKEGIDFVAASFVRKPEDIEAIRDCLGPRGAHIKIIAKIENHEGLDNYEKILKVTDGIMVARGDLGMEINVEKLFIAQKYMIDRANIAGVPIVTATQMLESMIHAPRPTRAEASDVANSVFDGTDCVMLSGETASGDFPKEAVEFMSKCCVEAEGCLNYKKITELIAENTPKPLSDCEAICVASIKAATDVGASLIVVITESGHLARLMAKYRPKQPILALCMSNSVIRQMNCSRGVFSLKIPSFLGTDNLIQNAIKYAIEVNYIHSGDKLVVVLGNNENTPDQASLMKIMTA